MKVGLLLVCTGRYDIFLQPLIDSVDKWFFRNDTITIYLFTDKTDLKLLHSDRINIVTIPIPHKPFPFATLYRYKYFTAASHLIDTEYVFYMDVDFLCVSNIGREMLPNESGLTATIHPGFYQGGGSWDENKNSNAYMTKEQQRKYYAGGFAGGKREVYLSACKEMSELISDDERRGVMPVWHDESMWNKYLCTRNPKELSPSYCFPQNWRLPFQKKMLALEKDHKAIRS